MKYSQAQKIMNPQATFYALLDAIHKNDRVAVNEKLVELMESNKKGEALPIVEKIERFDGLYQVWRK